MIESQKEETLELYTIYNIHVRLLYVMLYNIVLYYITVHNTTYYNVVT